ncbi:MAG: flagellar motor protein MotD [Gammaproteobacteria bacterium]|nr:flagellar motor protein MotD [Gammaproteobacteria bacterium]
MRRNGRRNYNSHQPESHDKERWLISYADFITLLFAFFVVMYAISTVNNGKYRVMADSIVEAFNDPNKTLKPQSTGVFAGEPTTRDIIETIESVQTVVNNPSIPGEEEENPDVIAEPVLTGNTESSQPVAEEDLVAVPGDNSIEEIARNITEQVKPQIDEEAVSISHSDDFIEVEINNNVLFPSGSARLNSEALPILISLSEVFKTFNNAIQVEGFTDNEPIRTTAFPSNWELSAARAASVVHLFMKAGIEPDRMVAVGYGEHRPVASNDTEEGRRRNRRVVIVIPATEQGEHIMDADARDVRRGATGQKRVPMDL